MTKFLLLLLFGMALTGVAVVCVALWLRAIDTRRRMKGTAVRKRRAERAARVIHRDPVEKPE